jgi:hypothetical protein
MQEIAAKKLRGERCKRTGDLEAKIFRGVERRQDGGVLISG